MTRKKTPSLPQQMSSRHSSNSVKELKALSSGLKFSSPNILLEAMLYSLHKGPIQLASEICKRLHRLAVT